MTKRRGNNEGTITQRVDNRWEAKISLPDGKRKSFYGKTRQEVQRKLAQGKRDVEAGLPVANDRQRFDYYLNNWLDSIKHRVKPTSYKRYRTNLCYHILPSFGGVALSSLTAQQIQAFYTKKLDAGLSASTVLNIHTVLHSALKDAVRLGLIPRNVTDMVQKPRRRRTRNTTFSEEQVRIFLEAIRGNRLEALYILALTTGMREGELLGLSWNDIDLEQGMIQVTMSLQEGDDSYKRILGDPKTAHSRRRISLSKSAVLALRRHRVLQEDEKGFRGVVWDGHYDLVFPNTLGRPLDPRHLLNRLFRPLLKAASLPCIRFHDLRHTTATLLLRRRVNPKVVSEMLGHANVSITLDIYSHVTPDMQEAAAEIMDSLFQDNTESDNHT